MNTYEKVARIPKEVVSQYLNNMPLVIAELIKCFNFAYKKVNGYKPFTNIRCYSEIDNNGDTLIHLEMDIEEKYSETKL